MPSGRQSQLLQPNTVNFDLDGGSPVNAIENIPHNTSISKPTDPTKEGETFVNWLKDTEKTQAFNFVSETITADITLYAKWEIITFTVTFNLNYADSEPIVRTVNSGTTVTKETPTRTNYNFVDWYETATPTDTNVPFAFTTEINEDKTLYAKWTSNPVVTFNTLGGSEVPSQTIEGGMVNAPNPASIRTHYILVGWYENEQLTGIQVTFPKSVLTSITLYAKWTRIAYTVTFNLNYENAPNGGTEDSNQEGKVMKTDPIRTNYTFNGWFTEATGGTKIDLPTQVFDRATNLYAQWTRIVYTVIFNLNYINAPNGG